MVDITGAEVVEVTVRSDGKVLWVNTEKGCVLRICQIENLDIVDHRVRRKRKAVPLEPAVSKCEDCGREGVWDGSQLRCPKCRAKRRKKK